MATYQRLSPAEIEEIAARYYAVREPKTQQQEIPTLVLVGGQPGAGKSVVSRIARAELGQRGGFIHIDADRLRAHIDTKGTSPTSEETQPDAGALSSALRAHAIKGRRNIIEEGTFRLPELVEAFLTNNQTKGQKVELVAVASSREESVLGIYQRLELQHAYSIVNPRFVAETYHDEAMDGFSRTVARTEHLFDRVRVVDRAGREHFDSQTNPKDSSAIEALSKGQQITDARLVEVAAAWVTVRDQAMRRGADTAYIEAIDRNAADVVDTQKWRIHAHALERLNANFQALGTDPRFSAHTGIELTKAAYYRGFHEKAFEFTGIKTDFVAYDAAMVDLEKIKKLPEVAELEYRHLEREELSIRVDEDGLSL